MADLQVQVFDYNTQGEDDYRALAIKVRKLALFDEMSKDLKKGLTEIKGRLQRDIEDCSKCVLSPDFSKTDEDIMINENENTFDRLIKEQLKTICKIAFNREK